jgi:hypothetical protein
MSGIELPKWVVIAALAALIAIPTGLAAFGRSYSVIWPVVIACCAAAILIRLPDVELFKVGPLEARLRLATAKAEATVEQLQQLAAMLAQPVLGSVGGAGRFAGPDDRRERYELVQHVLSQLRDMGLSNNQLREALSGFSRWVLVDLALDLQQTVHSAFRNTPEADAARGCLSQLTSGDTNQESIVAAKTCLKKLGQFSDAINEAFLDLEQYERGQTLRRPDVYFRSRP